MGTILYQNLTNATESGTEDVAVLPEGGTHQQDDSGTKIDDEEVPHILSLSHVRIILILLYSIVFFACVSGNLAVIVVERIHRKLHNTTTFILGQFAIANLFVGIFSIYPRLASYLIET